MILDYATNKTKSGQALVLALVVMAVGSLLSVSLIQFATFDLTAANRFKRTNQAEFLAEAGIERALYELNQNGNYSGGTYTDLAGGSYVVTVTTSGSDKIITSEGLLPQGATASTAVAKQKRRAKLSVDVGAGNIQTIPVDNAVTSNTGGIEMFNTATIAGDAKTNGNIVCNQPQNTVTGVATAAGSILPSLAVCAPHPNSRQNAGTQPFPTFDYQLWKNKAINGGDITPPDLSFTGATATIGEKRIVGDLTLSNNAILYLTGVVYVTGNLTLNNSSQVLLDQSLINANLSTVLIVDGVTSINQTAKIEGTASLFIILGTPASGITSVTLNQSNSTGQGVIIFATFSTVRIEQSSNGIAVVANRLELHNNATVNFSSAAVSGSYTSGGTAQAPATYKFAKGSFQELKY